MNKFGINRAAAEYLAGAVAGIRRVVDPTLETDSIVKYCREADAIRSGWAYPLKRPVLDSDYKPIFYGDVEDMEESVGENSMIKSKSSNSSPPVVSTDQVTVFNTFTTEKALSPGLSILRPLSNGKYEILSLEAISLETLKHAVGGGLELDKNPARAGMFHLTTYKLVDAAIKCSVGAQYSNKHIFRFRDLPLELRFKIYDLFAPKVTVKPRGDSTCEFHGNAFTLMSVCRDFHAEVRQLYYKYNFCIRSRQMRFTMPEPDIAANIQEITFSWYGIRREADIFKKLENFPKLKILNLNLKEFKEFAHKNGNKTYQDIESIKPYSQQAGFDALVQLRGLESVTVKRWPNNGHNPLPEEQAILKAFETFLNNTLTIPKPSVSRKNVAKPQGRKAKASGS